MLSGAPNFRDLGGHAVGSARRVRFGMMYRSSQLSHLTDGDLETLDALAIVTTIDFRSLRERLAQPTPDRLRAADDYLSPKSDTDFVFDKIFVGSEQTSAAWAEGFAAFYRLMLDDYAPEFIALFRALADTRTPLLFHCSAGKDRTGAAAALLLDLLGVARSEILRDYLHSSTRLGDDTHFRNMLSDAKLDLYADLPAECRQVMLGTDPAYLNGLFHALDDRFGSAAGYLAHHGFQASEIAHIVDTLTEPAPQVAGAA